MVYRFFSDKRIYNYNNIYYKIIYIIYIIITLSPSAPFLFKFSFFSQSNISVN